jgi:phospholipase A1
MQQLSHKSVECCHKTEINTIFRRTPPMRTYLAWLLAAVALPLTAYAQEATVKEVHDTPAVRGSIIANLLQEHDNPFTLYPYDTNYCSTWTSDLNKEAIRL